MNQPSMPPAELEESYHRYLAGLLAYDHHQCRKNFEQWLESGVELRLLYEHLVQRSLYEVGELWERGHISVATEHFATGVTESLLNLVYPRLFATPRVGKSAIVACGANEHHQIGAKIVADIFELNGWRSCFLGANTPDRDLLALISEKHPDLVVLSLTMSFSLDSLVATASKIRDIFPDLPILAGGQAFRLGGRERIEGLPGARCMTGLGELEAWLKLGNNHVL